MIKSLLIERRRFLLSGAALSVALWGSAKESCAQQHPPSDAYRDFESSDVPDLRPFGTDPAKSDEVAKADKLLLASPHKKQPIDTMVYFEHLQDRNGDGEAYNGGWQKRWNPVIVRFFKETKTTPSGDTTAWCAAALNWALERSGYRGTQSASSGSFRDAPGITETPHEGDIVVFARTDPDEARVGHGHVGLFLKQTNDSIFVLGGNQTNTAGHHAICRKWIKKKGALLTFDSFHALSGFKQI